MAKRKSATRRNKSFKAVDPFAKGKSTKGLGTDQGFDYGGRAEIGNMKMLKKMKGQKMNPEKKKKKEKPVHTKTTAVHKLMMEGLINYLKFFINSKKKAATNPTPKSSSSSARTSRNASFWPESSTSATIQLK